MASFLITLNNPNCLNCFRFYYSFEPNYFRNCATDLRPIFRIGRLRREWCEIGLHSFNGRCHGNHFFVIQSTHFCHSDQCVINFVHSATTRSTIAIVIHEVDRRPVLLVATLIHRGTDIFPSYISPTLACDGIRQEVQVLRGTQVNQLTDQLTIINRRLWG